MSADPPPPCAHCGLPIEGVIICVEPCFTLHFECAWPRLPCYHGIQRAMSEKWKYHYQRGPRMY